MIVNKYFVHNYNSEGVTLPLGLVDIHTPQILAWQQTWQPLDVAECSQSSPSQQGLPLPCTV